MRSVTLLILLSLLLTPIVCAQSTSTASTNQAGTTVEPTITHYSLTPEKLQKAEGLYKIIVVFVTLSTIYGFVVLLALLRFDVGPRFRNLAERLSVFGTDPITASHGAMIVPHAALAERPDLLATLYGDYVFRRMELDAEFGTGILVKSVAIFSRQGGTLKLLNVTSRVHELLMITKLLSVFDLFDAEAEAVKSFGVARHP